MYLNEAISNGFHHLPNSGKSEQNMLQLKTLDRNYRIFVTIGVCAAPSSTSLLKKCGYISLGLVICLSYVITTIASALFVLEFMHKDFGRALNATYPGKSLILLKRLEQHLRRFLLAGYLTQRKKLWIECASNFALELQKI